MTSLISLQLQLDATIVEMERSKTVYLDHQRQSNFAGSLVVADQRKFLGEKAGHLQNKIGDIRRSVGKVLSLVVLFVAALMSSAQSPAPVLHVTAVRDWAPTDPAPVSRVKCYVITGTVGFRSLHGGAALHVGESTLSSRRGLSSHCRRTGAQGPHDRQEGPRGR
jgi:hypothetical protein